MRNSSGRPLGAVGRGLLAGVAGTAAMTVHQEIVRRLRTPRTDDGPPDACSDPWKHAPAPAIAAKRVLEGLFGREVPAERIGLLTNAMHWGYGIAWGGVFGLFEETVRPRPLVAGPIFGAAVWAASYVQLVPMGLYRPPWEYPPKVIANDFGYHATYGVVVAAADDLLRLA